ncbi:MAG: hypothetical protein ACM3VS_07650 [Candidatus Dadabacteria bacterium]
MKSWFYILPLVFFACQRDHSQTQLTVDQVNAVKLMTSSYSLAKVYNDSLVAAVNDIIPHADATMINHLESMYHHYDTEFESCHNSYEHNNSAADHSHSSSGTTQMHNTGMMGSGGGMMQTCNCCSNGGHDAGIHEKMAALHQLYASYHH